MEYMRRDWFYNAITFLTGATATSYFRVEYEGFEKIPRKGAAIVLAKHHSNIDIVLEADSVALLNNRYCNWVMKASLPKVLEWGGGVRINRPGKEISKDLSEEQKSLLIEENEKAFKYLTDLLDNRELIVSHPEGSRYFGKMGPVKTGVVKHLRNHSEEKGYDVPVFPLGISYSSKKPFAKVVLRVGEPISIHQEGLIEVVKEEITRLSGF
ncbi:1-acyl-sn-glycerol-3-phosphate acyltransferase [Candidatus Woesearchaeota archaeon]|nr:1-acyl-sn-glycerol-3-phosphate acyltransferase [Candidatus Woesearchaeota archaeon]